MSNNTQNNFKQRLLDLGACDDAVAWVGDRDEATAWRECERGDWLIWYLRESRAEVTDRQWRHIACGIAQDAVDRSWQGGPEP